MRECIHAKCGIHADHLKASREGTHPPCVLLLEDMLAKNGPLEHDPGFPKSKVVKQRQVAGSGWGVILFLTLLSGQVDAHVALDFPNGGERLEAGSVVQIKWHDAVDHGPADYDLWYSITGPDGPGWTSQVIFRDLDLSLRRTIG